MGMEHSLEELRLRPHHIFCQHFSAWDVPDRGEAYNSLEQRIREALRSATGTMIEVVEGVDDLCRWCPLCQDGRCCSPEGDETSVRKWDAIILSGLGVSYGDRMAAGVFSRLILEKAPLAFCQNRCSLRAGCSANSPRQDV